MHALEVIFSIGLVIGPYFGYVVQYAEIVKTNSIDGYAPIVSVILLTSNTLRILYYIGHRYLIALLLQAFLGVAVHGVMLWTVLEVHTRLTLRETAEDAYEHGGAADVAAVSPAATGPGAAARDAAKAGGSSAKRDPTLNEAEDPAQTPHTAAEAAVWAAARRGADGYDGRNAGAAQAADASDYAPASHAGGFQGAVHKLLSFLFFVEDGVEHWLMRHTPIQFMYHYVIAAVATLVAVLVYYATLGRAWKGAPEVVGYASLGIEALMVLPQILRNARRRSTEGLSLLLILTWVGGDLVKVVYYIYAGQALAFIVCGCFQILLDVVVVAQLVFYRILNRREGTNGSSDNVVSVHETNAQSLSHQSDY